MVPLKNTASLHFANSLIVCRSSASLPKRRNATTSKVDTLFNCCILRNHINRRFLYHIIRTGCWITNPYTYCCKSAEFCFSSCAFEELLELIPHTDTDIEFHTDRRYFSPSSFGVFYYLFYCFWLIHLKTEH